MPSFYAAIKGYTEGITPYFLIDFSNDNTVVWDSACQQYVTQPYGPCYAAPTYLNTNFTNTSEIIGPFGNKEFGGYLCNGYITWTTVCVSQTCRLIQVYAVTEITEDSWIYGQSGAYGILGYGPKSPFWNQYIDQTGVAQFSVALAQSQVT